MKNEQEVQQKYMEMQMVQMQMQQVGQQVQALEAQANEMDVVNQALEEFSRSEIDSDMFVTLTPGLFVKAQLKQTDKVLLNVGGGAVVEKTIPEAQNIVSTQGGELRKLQEELSGQMKKLGERAQQVQLELQKLVK